MSTVIFFPIHPGPSGTRCKSSGSDQTVGPHVLRNPVKSNVVRVPRTRDTMREYVGLGVRVEHERQAGRVSLAAALGHA